MSLFGGGATTNAANAAQQAQGDTSQDIPIQSPPDDSISDISFSPQSEHLAAASWDKKVRIYEIAADGSSVGKAMYDHEGPVLSVHWAKDGSKVVSGGADKAARMFDVSTGQSQQVAVHDQPVKCVRMISMPGSNQEMLVTGSWDKKVKYWDLRTPNPVATLDMQERVYTMDVQQGLMVIGLAERYINIVNLANPGSIFKTMQSPLKWQTRVVSCFPDATGFAVGSIEGRCAIQYVDDKNSSMNFSFKCHRETPAGNTSTTNVYSVNAISFHPTYGTFSTAGSDGTFHFWDKDAKHRLKGYPSVGGTIPATAFNRNGNIFAYAVSYDWSKGHTANSPQYPNKIMLHPMKEDEAKPRPATKKR
ncbi:WD40-repeat-containing domain protein [Sphaerosporella brunnea]|uniref:WD40-repeat-containing domain protein n=1 Tax=Sphaerosporella brunnea TaxID=1250544 RepID=A0A5J5ESY7_9PEZI|nr:WD40-repeat-containing domain protein [Sphaerosporella brunnea]